VLVADPGHEVEAATRLGRIGFDGVAGYLAGAMHALETAPELIEHTPRVTAAALADLLRSGEPPLVVDVRTEQEWQAGRIDGAAHFPLSRLRDQIRELPSGRAIVVYCASGYRSAIAASVMRREHVAEVSDLVGGLGAWGAAHLQTVSAAPGPR
jgi:rhodanese-related sulfurtransferase